MNAKEDMQDIYLDYAAATPVDPRVLEAMLPFFTDQFENPSAPYARARKAKQTLEGARASLAHAIGAKPASITFTAGATEANNLAFAAVEGPVLIDAIEHDSIRAVATSREHGIVPVETDGRVSAESLANAITPETELVSIALANGEIGTVQPIAELSRVVSTEREQRLSEGNTTPIYLHTDASQAPCTLSVNVSSLGVDLMTLSAAKISGPKQVGLLWAREGIALAPLVRGGGQEHGLRSGTENVAGVVGFAKAMELAEADRKNESKRLRALRNLMQARLTSAFPDAVVSGPRKDSQRLDTLLHISFPGVEARRLVIALDQRGVSVGTGSACAASKMRISPVLTAIGLDENTANGSLRITLGHASTQDEVEQACNIIEDVVAREYERVEKRGGRA